MMVDNLPSLKVVVKDSYLTQHPTNNDLTQAYLVAVKSEQSQALKFTVFLETGALWSGLTIDALLCFRYDLPGFSEYDEYTLQELQPYSCLSDQIQVISYKFMKNYMGRFKIGDDVVPGAYLFTIETIGEGTLADDPEQFKTFNVIQLYNNQLAALPNNYCYWDDDYFVDKTKQDKVRSYRRNSEYPLPGG